MKCLIISILLTLSAVAINADNAADYASKDYCDPSLCMIYTGKEYVNKPHIGCNNTGVSNRYSNSKKY